MPLYIFRCELGHELEAYVRSYAEVRTMWSQCPQCLRKMTYKPTCGGRGMLWAEEGRPRVIENLGEKPIVVTSRKAHQEAMKRAGVLEGGSRRGEKGSWV